jgi:hypothetical protein
VAAPERLSSCLLRADGTPGAAHKARFLRETGVSVFGIHFARPTRVMVTTNVQAGGELNGRSAQILVLGRNKWSFGPAGPILRALGLGFTLGAILTAMVTFLVHH